mmetsp:Transcript_7310/g.9021  ORF Transcript_7310/g.9021 Transcript_7310/m.9021 type:complete len:231 (+) Transcript_7310:104-796(+)
MRSAAFSSAIAASCFCRCCALSVASVRFIIFCIFAFSFSAGVNFGLGTTGGCGGGAFTFEVAASAGPPFLAPPSLGGSERRYDRWLSRCWGGDRSRSRSRCCCCCGCLCLSVYLFLVSLLFLVESGGASSSLSKEETRRRAGKKLARTALWPMPPPLSSKPLLPCSLPSSPMLPPYPPPPPAPDAALVESTAVSKQVMNSTLGPPPDCSSLSYPLFPRAPPSVCLPLLVP